MRSPASGRADVPTTCSPEFVTPQPGRRPAYVEAEAPPDSDSTMTDPNIRPHDEVPRETQRYLAHRLDGARDLYLLALGLGERHDASRHFGRMIREARIHFAAVIEEARIAGLDTSAIAAMLGKSTSELGDGIRPDLRARVEQLLSEAASNRAKRRGTS
jgi:hypothetical protein